MKLPIERLLELLPGFRLDHRGKNLTGPCPRCGHTEFGISLEEGHKFGCYRKNKCGYNGNIFVLLKELGKLDEILEERIRNLPDKLISASTFSDYKDFELPIMTLPFGWKRTFSHPYLDDRGFTEEDYHRYPVGVTQIDPILKKDYVIFTCEQQKQTRGWVGRRLGTKEEIEALNKLRKAKGLKEVQRYRNSFSEFGYMCYGIDEISDQTHTLIIVEGIFDKVNTDKKLNLHNSVHKKCIATYKAAISHEQIATIMKYGKNIKNVILLYDGDVVKSIKSSMNVLQSYYNVLVGYHKEKDPGEMNEEDFHQVLSTLETPIEFKSFKLEVKKL